MEINKRFEEIFASKVDKKFSCGGRFEILGNHTDHNHGKCLAGTCSLAIYAGVRKTNDNIVTVYSEGFGTFKADLSILAYEEKEKGTSTALIRGIASYLVDNGYKVGGMNIYMVSQVPGGAGVSSSAAFELLIAEIYNYMFNEDKIDRLLLCKAGQFAERNYYGKMCGLLDQIGVGFGGSVYIDFKDINAPIVVPKAIDMTGYHWLIVDSGSSHAGLDHLYKAIPDDMFKVAHYFNKDFLREITFDDLFPNKRNIIETLGETPYSRAFHFLSENERVEHGKRAIENNDLVTLMRLMDDSCFSSTKYLKNMFVDKVEGSPLDVCIFIKNIAGDKAGVKINGGGFAGSVIALVKDEIYDELVNKLKEKYSHSQIYEIEIRENGPSLIN